MSTALQTPMMRQYLEIKSQHQESILFFRMGDFYEMFLDDALLASRILDITLTSRNRSGGDDIPFCGVPYHSAQPYIARLVEAGYHVAICEQTEDPKMAKGIVSRDVVKVITPALVTESESLVPEDNSFLLAIADHGGRWGSAWLDLSTGEFRAAELDSITDTATLLASISPREILLSDSLRREMPTEIETIVGDRPRSSVGDWVLDKDYAAQLVCGHFGVASPDMIGIDDIRSNLLLAVGMVLHYLQENRHARLPHIRELLIVRQTDHLSLDPFTRRNLELTSTMTDGKKVGSLLGCLDRTVTAMGARSLKQWISYPLVQAAAIRNRLEAVEELKDQQTLREQLRAALGKIHDLERLNGRVGMAGAGGRDLRALYESLEQVPGVRLLLADSSAPMLRELVTELDPLKDIRSLIETAISPSPPFSLREGGIIADGFNAELDELRAISREGKGFIARLEAKERETTGINSLKIKYNKVFGYYIEVTKANLSSVPADYIRRQTIAGGERYITEELKSYEEKVLGAEERICDLEFSLFQEVREQTASQGGRISRTAAALAKLDVLASLAQVAQEMSYCKPAVNDGDIIEIIEGRHPVVEAMNLGERFVPNDTLLDQEQNQILMITGPNMAGKSTYMRQVALITLMAQAGSFVPATSAVIGIADRIFTRVGAGDNLARGQSTFMVEMMETAHILRNATSKSLVVLDEIGRGTSTFDGLSIAWAVTERLHDRKESRARTLFATHYHELADLAATREGITNLTVAVKEWNDQVIFLRTIVPGAASHSYGIQVARLAGMPPDLIERAREVLKTLEEGEFEQGAPRLSKTKTPLPRQENRQFSLFEPQGDLLRERLKKANISTMTPLEALNLLDELKKML